jgi:hypothetical protein
MTTRPIIFSAPMVRAILQEIEMPGAGKTQTRRVLRDGAPPPYTKGDLLWVRETFVIEENIEYRRHEHEPLPTDRPIKVHDYGPDWGKGDLIPHYRATEPEPHIVSDAAFAAGDDRTRWTSPHFMPKWASRITLDVLDVRIERLRAICEDDARREGVGAVEEFAELWDSLNVNRDGGAYGWEKNPFVTVITFRPYCMNVDALPFLRALECAQALPAS